MKWIKTSEELPKCDKNKSLACLAVFRGQVEILIWNQHYQSWDDSSGDDTHCEALEVEWWSNIPDTPEQIERKRGA